MESRIHTQPLPELTSQALQKELSKSKELIDNFIYSCSHGLRSPIKSMEGLMMLIKQCAADNYSERTLYTRLLINSISKARSIREQLEDFSRITLDCHPTDLIPFRALLKSLTKEFEKQIDQYNLHVKVHILQKENFYCYARGLRSILTQLLSNALVFQRNGQTPEEISVFITASKYGCSVQVHDHGIGIAPALNEKIFTLFFRGSEKSQGAGMGLYIAREVTLKMGGTLSVHSSEQEGSVFSLWLPNQATKTGSSYPL